MRNLVFNICFILLGVFGLSQTYEDLPYLQDQAHHFLKETPAILYDLQTDRNQNSIVLSNEGLLFPWQGHLKKYKQYRPLNDLEILAITGFEGQFYYMTSAAVFSNAFGGSFYLEHQLPQATHFSMGKEAVVLVVSSQRLRLFDQKKQMQLDIILTQKPIAIQYDDLNNSFLILTVNGLVHLDVKSKKLEKVFTANNLTAIALQQDKIALGSANGIHFLNRQNFQKERTLKALPHTEITALKTIGKSLWVGTTKGAFSFRVDNTFDYYASQRWLVDDTVVALAAGSDQNVLVLTQNGLTEIHFSLMTLEQKAQHFQTIQRKRHIRYGLTSAVRLGKAGDLSSLELIDTDNDGLWTSMYLAAELLRYGTTQAEAAKQNAFEALLAMERLTEISGIDGFPARTYEIESYQQSGWKPNDSFGVWMPSKDPNWLWKTTTSSDESCGHFFVYALFAEIIKEPFWKGKAIDLMKRQMDHIIDNNWYLVSWDGKPTRWGRWHPDYVNSFPIAVGDRRLNATLILAFLQSTYHFTKEEKYKSLAKLLAEKYGYEENASRLADTIGFVEGQFLSDAWNHSDDEMYFLTAPAFVNYAFDHTMKKRHLESVQSHWELERSEKNPLWHFLFALAGGKNIDLEASVWWLKEFPMDLIDWKIENKHRKDVNRIPPNFRKQEFSSVLPPDERPLHLHNRAYQNHGGSGGFREYSPYVYLLPYWAGRYLGYITAGKVSEN